MVPENYTKSGNSVKYVYLPDKAVTNKSDKTDRQTDRQTDGLEFDKSSYLPFISG